MLNQRRKLESVAASQIACGRGPHGYFDHAKLKQQSHYGSPIAPDRSAEGYVTIWRTLLRLLKDALVSAIRGIALTGKTSRL